jgi:fructose-bisphosphate aldolase class 1
MKKVMLAAAVAALAATAAHAGSLADPIVEPEVIVETATSSSAAGIIVPLLFLAAVGAAIWLL